MGLPLLIFMRMRSLEFASQINLPWQPQKCLERNPCRCLNDLRSECHPLFWSFLSDRKGGVCVQPQDKVAKMSKSSKRSDSFKRKHWSIKAHESLICRNQEGHFCLNVEGGAEAGLFPFVGEIRQDRIRYQSGKLHYGELILEVNGKRVPGMIKKDVIALIKRSADPVSLVTVKQSE